MSDNRSPRVLVLALASLLLPIPAAAQKSSSPQPPSTGGNPGRSTSPPQTTTPTPPTNNGNQVNNTAPRPIINLTGRVMMDDGSELPQSTGIERVCTGNPHLEGHTDANGYFSISLGTTNADAIGDASTSQFSKFGPGVADGGAGGIGNVVGFDGRDLSNCELRARAPGYVSQSIQLGLRQALDNPDVGTILLHRIAGNGSEGSTISATSLAAPRNAKRALQKGYDLEKKHKMEEARASFQQAVDAYPQYAEAWCELGRLQAAQAQPEQARRSFDEAIHADSKFVLPYVQLALLEFQARRWNELAEMSSRAIRLDNFNFPEAFFYNAVGNYNLKHLDLAEQSARRAQTLDSQHRIPQASRLLGLILAARHDYAAAAAQLRDYLKYAPQAKDAAAVRSQAEEYETESASAARKE